MALELAFLHASALEDFAVFVEGRAERAGVVLAGGEGGFCGGEFRFDGGDFRVEVAQFRLPLKHGSGAVGFCAAGDDAFDAHEFACESGEGDFRVFAFQLEGGGQVRDDEDVGEQLVHHGADRVAGIDDIGGPCEAAFRRGEHLVFACGAQEILWKHEGLAELLLAEGIDDRFREERAGDEHGLKIRAEGRFDCWNVLAVDVDET